jgi:predicted NUDIX family NTP pyrophosphohydrolase
MVIKKSAGLLVYKKAGKKLYVFLAHPGGPFWARKDIGAWSIPKGEFDDSEDALSAARREFAEEIGQTVEGRFIALTPCRQPSRKIVYAWAIEGDVDETRVQSNHFEMEWPPRSGRTQSFPEVDRGRWFAVDEARAHLQPGQVPILEELMRKIETNDA